MTRSSLLLSLIRVAAPVALAVVSLGCNGAQVSTPPPYDAGPPCTTLAPIYTDCDAGQPVPVAACTTSNSNPDPTVALIPAGSYPVGCQVQFYFADLSAGGSCAPAPNECTCLPGDAGDGDAGSVAGQWSNCADAGLQELQ